MRLRTKIAIGAVAVFAAMQLVRCEHTNPPVTGEIQAPADVAAVLHRACYDCHSNETRWPWYSHVAPVSWLLQRDVTQGRRHVNFSEWTALPADRRAKKQKAVGKEVAAGEMPLWFYVPLHRDARLSTADKALLQSWASGTALGTLETKSK